MYKNVLKTKMGIAGDWTREKYFFITVFKITKDNKLGCATFLLFRINQKIPRLWHSELNSEKVPIREKSGLLIIFSHGVGPKRHVIIAVRNYATIYVLNVNNIYCTIFSILAHCVWFGSWFVIWTCLRNWNRKNQSIM